jgi:hypothetical protein
VDPGCYGGWAVLCSLEKIFLGISSLLLNGDLTLDANTLQILILVAFKGSISLPVTEFVTSPLVAKQH